MNPQRIAFILLIGGCFWGLILLPYFLLGGPRFWLIFGPGYLVTMGYALRAYDRTLSQSARKYFWIASVLVQGGWLAFAIVAMTLGRYFTPGLGIKGIVFSSITLAWWSLSFIASIYCYYKEDQVQTSE